MTFNWKGSIVGVIAIVLGVLWILQGTDSLGQNGGMNGNGDWTLIGAIVAILGLVWLVYTNWRRPVN
jgi:hypothetical protein